MQSLTDLYAALVKPENFIAAVSAGGAVASAVWAGIAILQARATRRLALEDAKARDANVDGYLNDTYLQTRNGLLQAVFDCTYVNKATHPNSIVRVELALHFMSQGASHVLLAPTKGVETESLALVCPAHIGAKATANGIMRFPLPKGLLPADVKRYELNAYLVDERVCTLSAHLMRRMDA